MESWVEEDSRKTGIDLDELLVELLWLVRLTVIEEV